LVSIKELYYDSRPTKSQYLQCKTKQNRYSITRRSK